MIRTTKKELIFFSDFAKMVDVIEEAAKHLDNFMKNYTEIQKKISQIHALENKCDDLGAQVLRAYKSGVYHPYRP